MAQRKPFDPYTLLSRPKREKMRRDPAGIVPGQRSAAKSTESVVLIILIIMVLMIGYACGNICGAIEWMPH